MTDTDKEKKANDRKMRQVYDLRVFVVGGGFQYIQMFEAAGFKGARSVNDADFICFTGGADVDPALYGEKAIPGTHYDRNRDNREAVIYSDALALGKPMTGICRGSQFLTVMNGGKLWQDVNNHAVHQGHSVMNLKNGEVIENMTSTHHQQMIPAKGAEVLAMASLTTYKKRDGDEMHREKPDLDDVEVVWYPKTQSLCFQPHPEFAEGECRDYFLNLVDEYILPGC